MRRSSVSLSSDQNYVHSLEENLEAIQKDMEELKSGMELYRQVSKTTRFLPKRFTAEQKGKAILIPSDDKAQVPHRPSKQPVKGLSSSSQQSSQRSTITKSSVHKPAATCTTEGAHMIELSNPFSALDDLIDT
ncbi:hypothetical protein HID58_073080 [Brassica napus]|uniref:Uncharacterized protein n=1 Tax=Brassica napus TaxID=3708 RepID=A0ABQ7Z6B1_BRANA|nr:hypothetical protein HID58_073080 [Brassica napus]